MEPDKTDLKMKKRVHAMNILLVKDLAAIQINIF